MKGFAIQKKDRIVVIGACPEEDFAKSEEELLEACEKYYKENGYEQVIPEGTSFTALEEYAEYYKSKGYSFDRFVEMDMYLRDYEMPPMPLPEGVTFGFYEGTLGDLHKLVAQVEEEWVQDFNEGDRFFCSYIDGEIASFCIVVGDEDCVIKDEHTRIGSVGCVGTLPKYRRRGIGLYMVALATQILKEEGCDKGFIHHTGFDKWYGRLGYRTFMCFEMSR